MINIELELYPNLAEQLDTASLVQKVKHLQTNIYIYKRFHLLATVNKCNVLIGFFLLS